MRYYIGWRGNESLERKLRRKSPKMKIYASGELRLLQMISEPGSLEEKSRKVKSGQYLLAI